MTLVRLIEKGTSDVIEDGLQERVTALTVGTRLCHRQDNSAGEQLVQSSASNKNESRSNVGSVSGNVATLINGGDVGYATTRPSLGCRANRPLLGMTSPRQFNRPSCCGEPI